MAGSRRNEDAKIFPPLCSAEEIFEDLQDFNKNIRNAFQCLTEVMLSFSAAEQENAYNGYRSDKLTTHNM